MLPGNIVYECRQTARRRFTTLPELRSVLRQHAVCGRGIAQRRRCQKIDGAWIVALQKRQKQNRLCAAMRVLRRQVLQNLPQPAKAMPMVRMRFIEKSSSQ